MTKPPPPAKAAAPSVAGKPQQTAPEPHDAEMLAYDKFGLRVIDATSYGQQVQGFMSRLRDAKANLHALTSQGASIERLSSEIEAARHHWHELEFGDMRRAAEGKLATSPLAERKALLGLIDKLTYTPPEEGQSSLSCFDFEDIQPLRLDMEIMLEQEIGQISEDPASNQDRASTLSAMLREEQKMLRGFIFEAELQQLLLQYLPPGDEPASKPDRRAATSSLSTKTLAAKNLASMNLAWRQLRQSMELLDLLPLTHLSFLPEAWEEKWGLIDSFESLIRHYSTALDGEIGYPAGKGDADLSTREFLCACCLTAARHYGFMPAWLLHAMLTIQNENYERKRDQGGSSGLDIESSNHRINGVIQKLEPHIQELARRGNWPTRVLIDRTIKAKRRINTRPLKDLPDEPVACKGNSRFELARVWFP